MAEADCSHDGRRVIRELRLVFSKQIFKLGAAALHV
jgi:hypothetical protein